MVDDINKDVSDSNLTTVISKVNLVGSNPKEWWIDIGATRHVCSNKKMPPLKKLGPGKRCSWATLPF